MLKILAIGDFHGKFPNKLKKEAKKADLILCTGDLGGSKELLKRIFKYFYQNWWEKVGEKKAKELVLKDYKYGRKIINKLKNLHKPIYIISGNWDFEGKSRKERNAGLKLKKYSDFMRGGKINFLRRKITKINSIKLYAFGGFVTASVYLKSKYFQKKKRDEFRKKHEKEIKQLFNNANKNIDIMLTHYPPYGYFDIVKYKGKNPMNGKHVGFIGYTKFIKKYKPKLFICGHMHEYQGMKKLGKTLIVSVGTAEKGKATLISFDEEKKKILNIKFLR